MSNTTTKTDLPAIPAKRYFNIGEVSFLCAVKSHVLRYWEQEFPQLKPSKRRGNRRYYQLRDILLIRKIRALLYEDGYTIDGARQHLSGKKTVVIAEEAKKNTLRDIIHDLEKLHHELSSTEEVN